MLPSLTTRVQSLGGTHTHGGRKRINFCKLSSGLHMHAVANIAKHSLLLTLKRVDECNKNNKKLRCRTPVRALFSEKVLKDQWWAFVW